jgi:valyl-tRNA synthetase
VPLVLVKPSATVRAHAARWGDTIRRLARVAEISEAEALDRGSIQLVVRGELAALPLAGVIDFEAERARLRKEMDKLGTDIAKVEAKLGNPDFLARAPEEVVEEQKERLEEARTRIAKIDEALERLGAP